jgi:hypothetical protein
VAIAFDVERGLPLEENALRQLEVIGQSASRSRRAGEKRDADDKEQSHCTADYYVFEIQLHT